MRHLSGGAKLNFSHFCPRPLCRCLISQFVILFSSRYVQQFEFKGFACLQCSFSFIFLPLEHATETFLEMRSPAFFPVILATFSLKLMSDDETVSRLHHDLPSIVFGEEISFNRLLACFLRAPRFIVPYF